jgi:hypothetical protein
LDPHPLAPWGRFLGFFRRRSVRVLKLHMGFILTKKEDINPPKNSETPLAPWRSIFRFKKKKKNSSSKVVIGFRNFGYDF